MDKTVLEQLNGQWKLLGEVPTEQEGITIVVGLWTYTINGKTYYQKDIAFRHPGDRVDNARGVSILIPQVSWGHLAELVKP